MMTWCKPDCKFCEALRDFVIAIWAVGLSVAIVGSAALLVFWILSQ